MLDVIKEYLVGLGFAVDEASYGQMLKSVDTAGISIEKFSGKAVTKFAVAASSIISFVAAANVSIMKFINTMAQADLENQKFARKMWMNPENARAMQSSLKAMNASIEDLYYSNEQLEKFIELKKQAQQMSTPVDYESSMKYVRSIIFEFQRLKLEVTYAMQWIGYYLVKYLFTPLDKFKFSLKDLNDKLVKTMPSWTKIIAQIISWFVRLGSAAYTAFSTIIDLLRSIPKELKIVAAAFAGLNIISSLGPIGLIMTAISGLLLLIDDFQTYKSGGKSLFGDKWKEFEKDVGIAKNKLHDFKEYMGNLFDDSKSKKTFKGLEDSVMHLGKTIMKFGKDTKDSFVQVFSSPEAKKAIKGFGEDISHLVRSIANFFKTILDSISLLLGDNKTKSLLKSFMDVALKAFEALDLVIKGIANGLDIITKFLQGKYKLDPFGIGNALGDKDLQMGGISYFFPNNQQDPTNKNKPSNPPAPIYPKTPPPSSLPKSNIVTNSVTVSPTYHVTTSGSASETGKAIADHTNKLLIRTLKGGKK